MREVVRDSHQTGDHVDQAGHPHFLTAGLRAYTSSGIVGRPSRATTDKGARVLAELTARASVHLDLLRSPTGPRRQRTDFTPAGQCRAVRAD
jgi:creatinine amidohydrolase